MDAAALSSAKTWGPSLGEWVESLPEAIRPKAELLLRETGLEPGLREGWHPLEPILEWLDRLLAEFGEEPVRLLGRRYLQQTRLPPRLESFERALQTLEITFHLNHRGGDVGVCLFRFRGPRQGELSIQSPYPCPFVVGLLEALGERFLPEGTPPLRIQRRDLPPQVGLEEGPPMLAFHLAW